MHVENAYFACLTFGQLTRQSQYGQPAIDQLD